jgi:hypothetical protein
LHIVPYGPVKNRIGVFMVEYSPQEGIEQVGEEELPEYALLIDIPGD